MSDLPTRHEDVSVQLAGDVVTMPRTWSQEMNANIGDMKNSVRTGSDRTNVVPIKRIS